MLLKETMSLRNFGNKVISTFCSHNVVRLLVLSILYFYSSLTAYTQNVTGYTEPNAVASPIFSLDANGESIFVHDYSTLTYTGEWNSFHYAFFEFTGAVTLTISMNQDISGWRISPENYDISYTQNGTEISFVLTKPEKLMLWNPQDRMTHKLAIFADLPADNIPDLSDPSVLNASNFNNLQEAVDAASQLSGGGTVYVPPGVYDGIPSFKSNVSLYLAPESKITSPIYGENLENVSVYGRGVFNTGPLSDAVRFEYSNNIHLEGFVTADGGVAILFDCFVSNVYNLKNFRVSERAQTIDANGANNLTIDNCFLFSSDDAAAIGYRHNQTDVVVKNSVLGIWGTGTCFKVAAGYRLEQAEPKYDFIGNYTYENCDCIVADRMAQIRQDCGGDVQNFYLKYCRFEEPFTPDNRVLGILYADFNPSSAEQGYGQIGNMFLADIEFPAGYVELRGLNEDHQVDNVYFQNVKVGGVPIVQEIQSELLTNDFVENVSFGNNESLSIINIQADTILFDENTELSRFVISRTGASNTAVTVPFTIRGTANNGIDYQSITNQQITLGVGIDEVFVDIVPICDGDDEGEETVHIQLLSSPLDLTWSLGSDFHAVATIIDFNECESLGNNYIEDNLSFKIYPVPTNDFIYLEGLDTTHETILYNTQGKILSQKKKTDEKTISFDMSTLSAGVYYIKVVNLLTEEIQTKAVIKY